MAKNPSTAKHPPATTILLVRHGQTPTTGQVLPGRAPGLHLADDGVRQAEIAAERIAGLPRVDAVYSSPLERAKETAAPIARARWPADQDRPWAPRVRLRRLDGQSAQGAVQAAGVGDRPAGAVDVPLSRR